MATPLAVAVRELADRLGANSSTRGSSWPRHAAHPRQGPATARSELLTTQMYVAGEPLNARDGLYRRLDPGERERVTVASVPEIEGGALAGTFEIVVAACKLPGPPSLGGP